MTFTLRISDDQLATALDKLTHLTSIPSVSNPKSPYYSMDTLNKAADFVAGELEALGFDVRKVSIDGSAPFVVARRIQDAALRTVLLYGHYDVQPVELDKWVSNPFIVEERDGRLYGRGVSDDKGGVIAILAALGALLKQNGALPVNIEVLIEGEEEYGSSHMEALLEQEEENLTADALVVVDGTNLDDKTGSLLSATRGLVNITVEVKALQKPVHSGVGCIAPDCSQTLVNILGSLTDPAAIPGLMDGAEKLSDEERALLRQSSQSEAEYRAETGVIEGALLRGSPYEAIYERVLTEPSISFVNGVWGQFGGGNSLQSEARSTVGIRIVPGQDPEHISEVVCRHLLSQPNPSNLQIDIKPSEEVAWAWKGNIAGPFSTAYLNSLAENFGRTSVLPTGGALPLLKLFQKHCPSMEMIVPGVEDNHTNAHSHNESQSISVFRKSVDSLISFLSKAAHIVRRS